MPSLTLYVITYGTKDYGDVYVVRTHTVCLGQVYVAKDPVGVAVDIVHARRLLPPGLRCLGRSAQDDPVICETWI